MYPLGFLSLAYHVQMLTSKRGLLLGKDIAVKTLPFFLIWKIRNRILSCPFEAMNCSRIFILIISCASIKNEEKGSHWFLWTEKWAKRNLSSYALALTLIFPFYQIYIEKNYLRLSDNNLLSNICISNIVKILKWLK